MRILRLLLALWVLIPSGPVLPIRAQQTAAWTIMVYMAADNDLDPHSGYDLNEMERVGSTEAVNVVVQADHTADSAMPDGAERFLVARDSDPFAVTTQPLGLLDETETGDPDTLVDFASWAVENYPAQRYALILWDHGGGWRGIAYDSSSGNDGLNLQELDGALAQIVDLIGAPLDVLGFDACLMGQLEVFNTVAPYSRYAVASQELIPGNGWNYTSLLQSLNADPAADEPTFGQLAVDTFMRFYARRATIYSLSVIDLSRVTDALAALEEFAAFVEDDPATILSAINDARSNTPVFGGNGNNRAADMWSAADLITFMTLVADLSPDEQVADAARQVAEAARSMVVYHQASSQVANSQGVAVFFPRTKGLFETPSASGPTFAERYMQTVPNLPASWLNFLNAYYDASLTGSPPHAAVTGVIPAGNRTALAVRVSGQNTADVSVAVTRARPDGPPVVLGYLPVSAPTVTTASGASVQQWSGGASTQTVEWQPQAPILSDGSGEAAVMFEPNAGNPTQLVVDGQYTPGTGARTSSRSGGAIWQEGEPLQGLLICDLETGTCGTLWAIVETPDGPVMFEAILAEGDSFEPTAFLLDDDGELIPVPSGTVLTLHEGGLDLYEAPLDAGDYTFYVVSESPGGESDSSAVRANLEMDEEGNVYIDEVDFMPQDDECFDEDGDGYCDDVSCPDEDEDGICDDGFCADADGDGFCDEDDEGCVDEDGDGYCDEDACEDVDEDGYCDESSEDCVDEDEDGYCDEEDAGCVDEDEDGYCDEATCEDADGDGYCDEDDAGCIDADEDGYCDDEGDGCVDADLNGICDDQEIGASDDGGSTDGGWIEDTGDGTDDGSGSEDTGGDSCEDADGDGYCD